MNNSILIIEDDTGLQKYIKELLLDKGYNAQTAADGVTGLNLIQKAPPDLVVLDLGLPNVSGETICTEIRKKYPSVQVIILTAKDGVSDIIHGLDLGADDYITKPFQAEELLARINARLRSKNGDNSTLKVGDLELNNKMLEVKREGKPIQLTPKEYKLLQYLISNKGRILPREMILNRVWLSSPDIETRVVDVYMGYLRKKVDSGFKKKLIHSVRGFGYMVKE